MKFTFQTENKMYILWKVLDSDHWIKKTLCLEEHKGWLQLRSYFLSSLHQFCWLWYCNIVTATLKSSLRQQSLMVQETWASDDQLVCKKANMFGKVILKLNYGVLPWWQICDTCARDNLEYWCKVMALHTFKFKFKGALLAWKFPKQCYQSIICQQVPFFLIGVSQVSEQSEHAERKLAFLTWTRWAVLYQPSQTFTVITFPWFLLCESCLVNIASEIHYLIFSLPALSFSSPLGECQSTTCGLFQSAVNSCWVLLLCLFVVHRCMILPSGLKRLPLFTVIRCDSDQREKAVCPMRQAWCSGAPCRSLHGGSGCCWLEPYGDKSKCHWWLRASGLCQTFMVFIVSTWLELCWLC